MKKQENIKRYMFSIFLRVIPVLIFAIMVGVSSCAPAGNMSLSENQNGKSIELKTGEKFQIKLDSNQTTGYSWKFSGKTDQKIISLISSEYKIEKNDKNLVGAGGYETFDFKALSEGQTKIILEYVRPWEKDTAPDKTFTIDVIVKD
jgi:inhibitor of cysteine peptidase